MTTKRERSERIPALNDELRKEDLMRERTSKRSDLFLKIAQTLQLNDEQLAALAMLLGESFQSDNKVIVDRYCNLLAQVATAKHSSERV